MRDDGGPDGPYRRRDACDLPVGDCKQEDVDNGCGHGE